MTRGGRLGTVSVVFIDVDAQGSPSLHDIADLKAFSISGRHPDVAALARLTEAGVELTDDAGHGFVAPDTLRGWAMASGSVPAGWEADFDAMVAYATSKGWTDDQGRLRAHTVWSPTE